MKNLKNDIKHYIKEVEKNLICTKSKKKLLIEDLTNQINDFVETNNITDIVDVKNHFGEPEDIAQEAILDEDIEAFKNLKTVTIVRSIFIVLFIIIFILLIIYYAKMLKQSHEDTHGYFVIDICVNYMQTILTR